jgi:hypothetical protein
VLNRGSWTFESRDYWLTIYCGTDDLKWDGIRWIDRYSGAVYYASERALALVRDGHLGGLALTPSDDPYAQWPVGAPHQIILGRHMILGLPGDVHQTLEHLYQTGNIKPEAHIRDFAQNALSVVLMHEMFHVTFHRLSEYSSPTRPH